MSEDEESTGRHEWVAVVVLAVTAVLTAWSGFEASKWGGEMSIAFSKASAARIEAARHAAEADAARGFDLNVFGIYVQAVAEGDTTLREFVETRFTDHFAVAFDSWLGTRPLENPDAPKSPFALPRVPATRGSGGRRSGRTRRRAVRPGVAGQSQGGQLHAAHRAVRLGVVLHR